VRNRQAFLGKHYKGAGRSQGPKPPADMPQHELDAIHAAAAKAGGGAPPKAASGRASRKAIKAEEGAGRPITERLRLQIPVAVETVS
jgi:hypothetical protein